jgi:hypothetical protein
MLLSQAGVVAEFGMNGRFLPTKFAKSYRLDLLTSLGSQVRIHFLWQFPLAKSRQVALIKNSQSQARGFNFSPYFSKV